MKVIGEDTELTEKKTKGFLGLTSSRIVKICNLGSILKCCGL